MACQKRKTADDAAAEKTHAVSLRRRRLRACAISCADILGDDASPFRAYHDSHAKFPAVMRMIDAQPRARRRDFQAGKGLRPARRQPFQQQRSEHSLPCAEPASPRARRHTSAHTTTNFAAAVAPASCRTRLRADAQLRHAGIFGGLSRKVFGISRAADIFCRF